MSREVQGGSTTKRTKRPPPMYSDGRHGQKFMILSSDPDPRLKLYVYIWDERHQRRVKPPVFIGHPSERAFDVLVEQFNGGTFNFIVRRGETIELSEMVGVASRLDRMAVFDAHKDKYGW